MRAFIFFKFVAIYYTIYNKKRKTQKISEFDRLWYKPDSVFVNHLSKSIITYGF